MALRGDDPRFIGKNVISVTSTGPSAPPAPRAEREDWTIGEPHEAETATGRAGQTTERTEGRRGSGRLLVFFVGFAMLALAAAMTGVTYAILLSQRAWVGQKGEPQILNALTAQGMRVKLTPWNFGKTPALRVSTTARLMATAPLGSSAVQRPPVTSCDAAAGTSGSVLFPATMTSYVAVLPGPIDPQVIQEVVSGQRKLYLLGCISYDDGLDVPGRTQPRYSTFCQEFVPDTAGPLGVSGSFIDCSSGNDAD
jgi:hypothetical protein